MAGKKNSVAPAEDQQEADVEAADEGENDKEKVWKVHWKASSVVLLRMKSPRRISSTFPAPTPSPSGSGTSWTSAAAPTSRACPLSRNTAKAGDFMAQLIL